MREREGKGAAERQNGSAACPIVMITRLPDTTTRW